MSIFSVDLTPLMHRGHHKRVYALIDAWRRCRHLPQPMTTAMTIVHPRLIDAGYVRCPFCCAPVQYETEHTADHDTPCADIQQQEIVHALTETPPPFAGQYVTDSNGTAYVYPEKELRALRRRVRKRFAEVLTRPASG